MKSVERLLSTDYERLKKKQTRSSNDAVAVVVVVEVVVVIAVVVIAVVVIAVVVVALVVVFNPASCKG